MVAFTKKARLVLCVLFVVAIFQFLPLGHNEGGPNTKEIPVSQDPETAPHLISKNYLVGIISHRPKELNNLLTSLSEAGMDKDIVYIWDDSPSHLQEIDAIIDEFGIKEVDKAFCTDEAVCSSCNSCSRYFRRYLFRIILLTQPC
jgi:hypothetical protein